MCGCAFDKVARCSHVFSRSASFLRKATRRQLYQPTSPAPTASFPHGAGGTGPHAETFPQEAAISGRRWIAAEILVDVHHTGRASSRVSPGPHPGPKRSLATGGRLAARSGLDLSHIDQFLATPHCVGIWCNSTNPLDDLSIIIVGVCLCLLQLLVFDRGPKKRPPTRVVMLAWQGQGCFWTLPARFTAPYLMLQLHRPACTQCKLIRWWADDDADEATRLNLGLF